MRGNNVNIRGTIVRDAEIRQTASGSQIASWSIVWNRSKKNQATGQYEDVPGFFDCQCWLTDKQLRIVQPLLVKGARCAIIDGHLEYQAWESNGQKRSKVMIQVDDPINGLVVATKSAPQDSAPADDGLDMYSDIPF